MNSIAQKEKKALMCNLYFNGTLSAKCVQALLDYMDNQCQRIIGIRFPNNNTSCGLMKGYEKDNVSKHQVGAYLSQIPLPNWYLYALASVTPFCSEFEVPPKGFDFKFGHPIEPQVFPYTGLRLEIEYVPPFDFTGQDIVQIMHDWIALLQKQGVQISYGYIEPMGKFRLQRHDQMYFSTAIPKHKLMGVRWGNLLSRQQLGKKPEALLAAINRTIAPEKVIPVGPDLYWFTLPFDLQTYNQATHPTYQAMMRRTLEAIKPYKVLWRNGIRKYFYV